MRNSDTLFKIILCTFLLFFFHQLFFSIILMVKRAQDFFISVQKWAERSRGLDECVGSEFKRELNFKQGTSLDGICRVTHMPVFKQGSDATMSLDIGPEILYIRKEKGSSWLRYCKFKLKTCHVPFFNPYNYRFLIHYIFILFCWLCFTDVKSKAEFLKK